MTDPLQVNVVSTSARLANSVATRGIALFPPEPVHKRCGPSCGFLDRITLASEGERFVVSGYVSYALCARPSTGAPSLQTLTPLRRRRFRGPSQKSLVVSRKFGKKWIRDEGCRPGRDTPHSDPPRPAHRARNGSERSPLAA